ncbi:MAG: alpha/beta fold hydrolase [Alkalispirochaeta sp.]
MSVALREQAAGGLFWRVFGESNPSGSTPLLVLHGLFGAGDNWRSHAEALAAQRLVMVPDMPNHGRSSHTEDMDFHSVARQLWSALDAACTALEVSSSQWAILGHSMGGKAAMAMAFHEPSRTERLISADIAPRAYPPSHGEIFEAMAAVAEAGVQRRSEADQIMAEQIPTKAIRMFLLKSLVRDESSGEYRWQLNLDGLRTCYEEIRGWPFHEDRYEGPTLFIAGENSPYIRTGDTGAIGDHFPHHHLETIPDVGHWLHVENRDLFLNLVSDFLS